MNFSTYICTASHASFVFSGFCVSNIFPLVLSFDVVCWVTERSFGLINNPAASVPKSSIWGALLEPNLTWSNSVKVDSMCKSYYDEF